MKHSASSKKRLTQRRRSCIVLGWGCLWFGCCLNDAPRGAGGFSSVATTRSMPPPHGRGTTTSLGVSAPESSRKAPARTPAERNSGRRRSSQSSGKSGEGPSLPASWSSPIYFSERSMLRHDLLTKQQEQVLGNAIRRANSIREQLEPMIEERRIQQYERQEQQNALSDGGREYLSDEEDDDDGDKDWAELSVYGLRSYIEDEQFQTRHRLSFLASKESKLQTQEDRKATDGYSSASGSYLADDLDLHLLTDRDIASIGISGGRRELDKILARGSLARQTLISGNVRLVMSIAKKWARMAAKRSVHASGSLAAVYSGGWDRPSLDEVIQEGVIGLARAVDGFEPKRNLRFSTYATFWVTNSVRRCFQAALTGTLRVPAQFHDQKRRYKLLLKQYAEMGRPTPGLEEMARELGISVERLDTVLRLTQPPLSTDQPFMRSAMSVAGKAGAGDFDDSLTISETLIDGADLSNEDRIDLSFLRESLEDAMAAELAPHERDILRLRLGLDDGISRSVQEVVREFDARVTMSEVRALERRAYKKLRQLRLLGAFLAHLDVAGVDSSTVTIR